MYTEKSFLYNFSWLLPMSLGVVMEPSMTFGLSPNSFEWEDDVSANWVQDEEVEDDDNRDTNGRLVDVQGVLNELLETPSNDPVHF